MALSSRQAGHPGGGCWALARRQPPKRTQRYAKDLMLETIAQAVYTARESVVSNVSMLNWQGECIIGAYILRLLSIGSVNEPMSCQRIQRSKRPQLTCVTCRQMLVFSGSQSTTLLNGTSSFWAALDRWAWGWSCLSLHW